MKIKFGFPCYILTSSWKIQMIFILAFNSDFDKANMKRDKATSPACTTQSKVKECLNKAAST